MYRVALTFLIGGMLLSSGSAKALNLACERVTENHNGFTTKQVFESWFPKYMHPKQSDEVPSDKPTQMRFEIDGVNYILTPSKWMIGSLPERSGYLSVTGIRYKCNASSAQVKVAFRTQAASVTSTTGSSQVASASTNSANLRACRSDKLAYRNLCFGTWTFPNGNKYVGEFRSGKFDGKGTYTFADGRAALEGIWKNGEFQYANKLAPISTTSEAASSTDNQADVSGLSNKTICSAATAGGRWEKRPNYLPHVKEAKRRGLTCGVGASVPTKAASINSSHLPACPSDGGYWHNCFGTYTNTKGGKYIGEYRHNERNGQGTFTFASGNKYAGEFRDNEMNGQGTFSFASGNKYDGEFRDNERNGQGTFTHVNGNKFVGEFRDGKANGQGTLTYANGDKHVGEFRDDKANGQGTLTYANGHKFVGEFRDGKANGQGTFTFASGNKYAGEFRDDRIQGQGTYTYANGDKHVGEFRDDRIHGQGTYTYASGMKDVGTFKDGALNGYAVRYDADGTILKQGIWKDDEFQYAKKLKPVGTTSELAKSTNNQADSVSASSGDNKVKWKIQVDDFALCSPITRLDEAGNRRWKIETSKDQKFQTEAKRRGLTCGVDNAFTTPRELYYSALDKALAQEYMVANVAFAEFLKMHPSHAKGSQALFWRGQMEFMSGKFDSAAMSFSEFASQFYDDSKYPEVVAIIAESVCHFAPKDQAIAIYKSLPNLLEKPNSALKRRLKALEDDAPCLMPENHRRPLIEKIKTELELAPSSVKANLIAQGQKITPTQAKTNSVAAVSIDLEAEREKRLQAEAELAALKAEKAKRQQKISADNQVPLITIVSAQTNGPQGTVSGRVSDNTGVAEVRIDGKSIGFDATGNFSTDTYVPEGGVSVKVEVFDLAGLSTSMAVRLDRVANQETGSLSFDRLNPLGRKVSKNPNALALIIGVDRYAKTPARAIYADTDAQVFKDYATQKLGILPNKIRTLINDTADEANFLLSVKNWLARAVKQEQSDVYIFFAGHGLPSADGAEIYLLPYDGTPELPEETTISRKKLFADIAAANPRSVTVFLDTCYSGVTRGEDFLIAARPALLRVGEQSIPAGFTVMTAAAGDQTAKPLEEAKHGMFSYFLMKGMEGDADANQDNQITASELQEYVYQHVVQQSSGSQTPELQGDADRVLVRFQ